LSVEVGLGVLRELLEAEVEEIVGPKGKHNLDRVAVRYGHEDRRGDARSPACGCQSAGGAATARGSSRRAGLSPHAAGLLEGRLSNLDAHGCVEQRRQPATQLRGMIEQARAGP
jgi:hypothetical protein